MAVPDAQLLRPPAPARLEPPAAHALQALSLESILHALHLYGAAGIAAFGWAVGQLIRCDPRPWLPLWFCAGLLVYNLDRFRLDPSDAVNTPARLAAVQRLRGWNGALALGSGALLLAWPLVTGDWLSLSCIVTGGTVALCYPLPLGGRRLKDVPLLKTFWPPAFVLGAVFGLPLLHAPAQFRVWETPVAIGWAGTLLLANMVLCDVRDVAGDRAAGVLSLPGCLGPAGTVRLLWGLAGAAAGLALLAAWCGEPMRRGVWLLLAAGVPACLAGLILAGRQVQPERFYERWVEGLLFLPGGLWLVAWALGFAP